MFVTLFFTKTGKYTEEEFTTAHDHFMSNGTAIHVHVLRERHDHHGSRS